MKNVNNKTREQWEEENNQLREELRKSRKAHIDDVAKHMTSYSDVVNQNNKLEAEVERLRNILSNFNLYSYINNP